MKNQYSTPFQSSRRRRRGVARMFVLSAAVMASGATARPVFAQAPGTPQANAQGTVGQATTLEFHIAAGSLDTVMNEFARVTGLRVTFADSGLAMIQSPGVIGSMTAQQAMERLLMGTSVGAVISSRVATLSVRGVDEFVAVRGEAPAPASPKYIEPLRDTPQTVVVIPQTVFQEQAATSLRDALRNTPGITITAGEGGAAPGDNINIRGFSARNDVYIDGARDPGVTSRDIFNTEAVEVAKGPSSVTTGRGSTGGSINLVTKTATLQDAAEVRLNAGNASQRRGTVDLNQRLSDTVAFRVNGMWQDSGVPGRDEITSKAWGFAPSLGFGLGRPTTFTLGYQRLNTDNLPDYGLPGTLPDLAVAAGKTVDDIDFSNFYGLLSRDYEKMTSDVVTATVEHRFGRGRSVRNLVRFGRNNLDRVVTSPRAALPANAATDPGYNPAVPQIRRTDTKYQYRVDTTVTNQTDFSATFSTGALEHDAVTGLELARDMQPSYAATDLFTNGRPPVTDLFNPDPTQVYAPAITRTGASSDALSHAVAAYAFDTVKINDKLQVDLGLRWDRIEVDYATVSAAGVPAQFGRTDKAASGRTGVVYKPVQRGTIYGAYSTSFNPSFDGGFGLTLAATGVNNAALPPERSHNVEFGSKWDVKSDLFATVALFRTNKTNAKTTDASGATVLAGDQQVTGVEFGLSGNLTERWAVFTGLSLMKGEIKESLVSAEVDKRLPYVPEKSFNVWTTYRLPLNVMVGGGAQYTGGYYFTNNNALATANAAAIQRLTRYWLFSATASVDINRHVSVQVNGTNLADERYVERGYTGHFLPGPGRGVLITPVFRF
ncbi:MAG: TonB-dependent siderophore receptor [Vicinamibacterales bacterium]